MNGFHGHISISDLRLEIKHSGERLFELVEAKSVDTTIWADGFIYNLPQQKNKYGSTEENSITASWNSSPADFPAELKGEFSTVVQHQEFIEVATNQTSSRRVFWAEFNGTVYFHYNLKLLQKELESQGHRLTSDPVSLRSLCSIGGVFGNRTIFKEVKILRAGEKLVVTTDGVRLKRYFLPNTSPTSLNKKDFLAELHERFLQVTEEQYQHPGFENFQLLSGGLDSRQNLSLAYSLGIQHTAVLCFSQTGYRDHWISEQMAKAYDTPHEFIPLENGDYLKAIDENTLAVDGLNFYASSAHFHQALHRSKTAQPLIHTGQIGRTIFTEHPFGLWQNLSEYSALLCTAKYADFIQTEVKKEMELYEDMDVFYLNNRLYRVISSGSFVAQTRGHLLSIFGDVDVQNLAYSAPAEWKKKGILQWEYLWEYHMPIMQFAQEEYGRKVRSHSEMFLGRVQNKLRNIYYKKLNPSPSLLSMNPVKYWYDMNTSLQEYWSLYYSENIDRISYEELRTMVSELYLNGTILEKTLALTVLSVYKNYFE